MKPHQKVVELAAQFTAQAYQAEEREHTKDGALAMLHRGERDAFYACAQRADKLARDLAEVDGFYASTEPAGGTAPPDAGVTEGGPLRQELSRLWAFVREVDARVTTAFDNLQGHAEFHRLFTREGSPDIFTRLDKLEKHLDSLSGANEMHASVHNQEQEERRRLERRITAREGGPEDVSPSRMGRRFGRA